MRPTLECGARNQHPASWPAHSDRTLRTVNVNERSSRRRRRTSTTVATGEMISTHRRFFLVAALLISLFLVYVPWESSGSRLPQYLAAMAPALLVGLVVPAAALGFMARPPIAGLLIAGMLLHSAVIEPVYTPVYFVGLLGNALSLLVLCSVSVLHKRSFALALRILLWIFVAGFLLQLALFLKDGELTDVHNWIFPTSVSRGAESYVNVTRLTGVHIEPGTHAIATIMALFCLRVVTGRFEWVSIVALGTVLGTYSTEGMVTSTAVIGWMLWDLVRSGRVRNLAWAGGLVALLAVLVWSLDIPTYLQERFVGREDGSKLYKEAVLDAYERLDIGAKLMGIGYDNLICVECSMDGLGFGFNMLMKGGVFFVLPLLFYFYVLLARRRVGLVGLVAVMAVVLVARFSVTIPMVWLVLFLMGEHTPLAARGGLRASRRIGRSVSRRRRSRRRSAKDSTETAASGHPTAEPAIQETGGIAVATTTR